MLLTPAVVSACDSGRPCLIRRPRTRSTVQMRCFSQHKKQANFKFQNYPDIFAVFLLLTFHQSMTPYKKQSDLAPAQWLLLRQEPLSLWWLSVHLSAARCWSRFSIRPLSECIGLGTMALCLCCRMTTLPGHHCPSGGSLLVFSLYKLALLANALGWASLPQGTLRSAERLQTPLTCF